MATPEASDSTENSVNIGAAASLPSASLKPTRRAYPMRMRGCAHLDKKRLSKWRLRRPSRDQALGHLGTGRSITIAGRPVQIAVASIKMLLMKRRELVPLSRAEGAAASTPFHYREA